MPATKAVLLVVTQLNLIHEVCHLFYNDFLKKFDDVGREGDRSLVHG